MNFTFETHFTATVNTPVFDMGTNYETHIVAFTPNNEPMDYIQGNQAEINLT